MEEIRSSLLIQGRDDGDVVDLANELGHDLLDDVIGAIDVALRGLPCRRALSTTRVVVPIYSGN